MLWYSLRLLLGCHTLPPDRSSFLSPFSLAQYSTTRDSHEERSESSTVGPLALAPPSLSLVVPIVLSSCQQEAGVAHGGFCACSAPIPFHPIPSSCGFSHRRYPRLAPRCRLCHRSAMNMMHRRFGQTATCLRRQKLQRQRPRPRPRPHHPHPHFGAKSTTCGCRLVLQRDRARGNKRRVATALGRKHGVAEYSSSFRAKSSSFDRALLYQCSAALPASFQRRQTSLREQHKLQPELCTSVYRATHVTRAVIGMARCSCKRKYRVNLEQQHLGWGRHGH